MSHLCVKWQMTVALVQNVTGFIMSHATWLIWAWCFCSLWEAAACAGLFFSPNLKNLSLTILSSLLSVSFAPPVSDSPSFSSAKLEEWSAINRTNFPPASSSLVNGVDKPHLEPEAKYTQVKKQNKTKGHLSFFVISNATKVKRVYPDSWQSGYPSNCNLSFYI